MTYRLAPRRVDDTGDGIGRAEAMGGQGTRWAGLACWVGWHQWVRYQVQEAWVVGWYEECTRCARLGAYEVYYPPRDTAQGKGCDANNLGKVLRWLLRDAEGSE